MAAFSLSQDLKGDSDLLDLIAECSNHLAASLSTLVLLDESDDDVDDDAIAEAQRAWERATFVHCALSLALPADAFELSLQALGARLEAAIDHPPCLRAPSEKLRLLFGAYETLTQPSVREH